MKLKLIRIDHKHLGAKAKVKESRNITTLKVKGYFLEGPVDDFNYDEETGLKSKLNKVSKHNFVEVGKKYKYDLKEYKNVVNQSGVTDEKGLIKYNLTSGNWLFQTIHVRGYRTYFFFQSRFIRKMLLMT